MFHRICAKILNEKSFETSNFYGLHKTHKSKVIEAAIHSQTQMY